MFRQCAKLPLVPYVKPVSPRTIKRLRYLDILNDQDAFDKILRKYFSHYDPDKVDRMLCKDIKELSDKVFNELVIPLIDDKEYAGLAKTLNRNLEEDEYDYLEVKPFLLNQIRKLCGLPEDIIFPVLTEDQKRQLKYKKILADPHKLKEVIGNMFVNFDANKDGGMDNQELLKFFNKIDEELSLPLTTEK